MWDEYKTVEVKDIDENKKYIWKAFPGLVLNGEHLKMLAEGRKYTEVELYEVPTLKSSDLVYVGKPKTTEHPFKKFKENN